MKRILLAGLLLSASSLCVVESHAAGSPVKQVRMALPKPVSDAYRALEAQYAAQGFILTNVQWTHSKNQYSASFLIADINSDNVFSSSATWLANGQRVAVVGTGTTPE